MAENPNADETLPYAHANPTRERPTALAGDVQDREINGSRGGLKFMRPAPDSPHGGSQFTGRLLRPAIHRPEEKVQ